MCLSDENALWGFWLGRYRSRPQAAEPVADAAVQANRNKHPNALRLADAFRRFGHLEAHINPLAPAPAKYEDC